MTIMKKFLFLLIAVLTSLASTAQKITCPDVTIDKGGNANLVFSIESNQESTLAEFSLTMPEGITVQKNSKGRYMFTKGDMPTDDHTVTINNKTNGDVYVLLKNEYGDNFESNSGTLITLPIVADASLTAGTYRIKVSGVNITNLEAKQINTENEFYVNVIVEGTDSVTPDTPVIVGSSKITAPDVTVQKGGKASLTFSIESDVESTLAEFSLTMPTGITVEKKSNGRYMFTKGDIPTEEHTVTVNDKTNGDVYVLLKNEYGDNFESNSGTLITLPIVADASLTAGTYSIKVSSVNITNLEAKQINTENEFYINVIVEGTDSVTPVTPIIEGGIKIKAANVAIQKDSNTDLVFSIESDQPSTLAEFFLTMPAGISIQKNSKGGYMFTKGDMPTEEHTVTVNDKTNGDIYVLLKNEYGDNFESNSGTLIILPIVADANLTAGTYRIKVSGVNITNLDAKQINTENEFYIDVTIEEPVIEKCATPIIDIQDGKMSLLCETEGVDFVYTISTAPIIESNGNNVILPKKLMFTVYATKDGYEPSDSVTEEIDIRTLVGKVGDVNGDGEIGMPDVMFIIQYILRGKFPNE